VLLAVVSNTNPITLSIAFHSLSKFTTASCCDDPVELGIMGTPRSFGDLSSGAPLIRIEILSSLSPLRYLDK
jgi:hypothetical protein